jgi:hypothetical protein
VYVNNDPVNWIDPWGLQPRPLTEAEKAAYIQKYGNDIDFSKITIIEGRMPAVSEMRNAADSVDIDHSMYNDSFIAQYTTDPNVRAMSLPDGTIYSRYDPIDPDDLRHELNHQSQYQNGAIKTIPGGPAKILNTAQEVYQELINEALDQSVDPYKTPGYLEYQAENRQPVPQKTNGNNYNR